MPRPQSHATRPSSSNERSLRPCLAPPIAPRRRGPILKPVLRINGQAYEVDAAVGRTLGETLREDLGLTGTKIACGEGHCGACTVRIDGVPMLSCITLVHTVEGREVTTIEGLRDHPLVEAFVKADALQCGFCTPGQIVSASALVEAVPEPTREEIRHAMAGNLCRCAAYPNIEEAVLAWQG